MTPEESRTHHASQAVHVSDLINLRFATRTYGTEAKRYLRATEPDGPSTDGGRKARQALMLVTKDEIVHGGGMVCGFIDVTSQVAEIRTYAVVSSHFTQRHNRTFDLSKGEYDRMQEQLESYLGQQGFQTRIATTPRKSSGAQLPKGAAALPAPARAKLFVVVAPIVSAAAVGFALCYLLVRLGLIA